MRVSSKYKRLNNLYVASELVPEPDNEEKYLLDIIKNAADIGTGSEELYLAIKDELTFIHLSPTRTNILRPFKDELKGKVILEIGSEYGALTRYLGELECQVVALENSFHKAAITAERCRDQKNITVICEDFLEFTSTLKFDFVVIIGIEKLFGLANGRDGLQTILQKAKQHLKKNGQQIIALDNILGLNTFILNPETNIPLDPSEKLTSAKNGSENWGKVELISLLTNSGFKNSVFYYPFPDYKFPEIIVSESGINSKKIDIPGLLLEKYNNRDFFKTKQQSQSGYLVVKNLSENLLLNNFANSFLVISNTTGRQRDLDHKYAYSYSTSRKREYCKENIFEFKPETGGQVVRTFIYDQKPQSRARVTQILKSERLFSGTLLLERALSIVSMPGWTLDELEDWALIYFGILKAKSFKKGQNFYLDPQYLDLTPFNILINENGETHFFDLEWVSKNPIPLHYIFFRGILNSLLRISYFNASVNDLPDTVQELAILLVKKSIKFTEKDLERSLVEEKKILQAVSLGNHLGFEQIPIPQFSKPILENNTGHVNSIPLKKVNFQLYWKKKDSNYSEPDSMRSSYVLKASNQICEIRLGATVDNVTSIRLDPGDLPGAFYLSSIRVLDSEKKTVFLWEFSKRTLLKIENALLVKSKLYPKKGILFALTNDPILEIDLSKAGKINYLNIRSVIIEASLISDIEMQKELMLINSFNLSNKKSFTQTQTGKSKNIE